MFVFSAWLQSCSLEMHKCGRLWRYCVSDARILFTLSDQIISKVLLQIVFMLSNESFINNFQVVVVVLFFVFARHSPTVSILL